MLQLLSLLSNLVWLVGAILACGAVFFIGRALLHRLGRGGAWQPYYRTRSSGVVEVGVKQNRLLSAPNRMPLDHLESSAVADDSKVLYHARAKAEQMAAVMNTRKDQSDY